MEGFVVAGWYVLLAFVCGFFFCVGAVAGMLVTVPDEVRKRNEEHNRRIIELLMERNETDYAKVARLTDHNSLLERICAAVEKR